MQTQEDRVKQYRQRMDLLILLVKSKGGYRYRSQIRLSETELAAAEATCEAELHDLARRLAVAEAMLREPPPSSNHMPRWDEYQSRCKETVG